MSSSLLHPLFQESHRVHHHILSALLVSLVGAHSFLGVNHMLAASLAGTSTSPTASSSSSSISPTLLPSQIPGVKVKILSKSVVLTVQAPKTPRKYPLIDYIVRYKKIGEPDTSYVLYKEAKNTSKYIIMRNLAKGTSYDIQVVGVNANGIGIYSLPVNVKTKGTSSGTGGGDSGTGVTIPSTGSGTPNTSSGITIFPPVFGGGGSGGGSSGGGSSGGGGVTPTPTPTNPSNTGTTTTPLPVSTTTYTYAWSSGTYGTCSVTCGGGTQTRTVSCIQTNTSTNATTTVADSLCTTTKPALTQACNMQACTPTPINGLCGTSNNQTLVSAPTTNLCTTGITSSVTTGTSTFTWSCGSVNGGSSVNCTASKQSTSSSGTTIPADALYVSTTGNDSTGNGTSMSPYKTISKGLSALVSGGTLIVKAGTYTGPLNQINQRMYPFPNGTATKYTTIQAEIPYSVRIENTGPLNYYDNLLYITGNYIKVDGFIYAHKDSIYSPAVGQVDGDYVKITRSIFKRQGAVDQYGGFFMLLGNNCLIEDVAGVGHARYGSYAGAGGGEDTISKNIFRRIVVRVDYVSSSQPKAPFAIYGSNSNITGTKDYLVQNLIVLDSQSGPTGGEGMYGGVYLPKTLQNIKIQGSIVLNTQADYAGYFIGEYPATSGVQLVNSVSWDNKGTVLAGVRHNANGGSILWDRLTIGGNAVGYYADGSGNGDIFRNSYFINNAKLTDTGPNSFTTSNLVSVPISQIQYITDSENATEGAKVLKKYGASGTLWGETGYDQETTESLWPWPYEDQIKAVFAESNPVPAGAVPATNNTKRGFAADGNDQFGMPMTLTRYIWQYLGNKIPDGIY